jgi:hypothetical protein
MIKMIVIGKVEGVNQDETRYGLKVQDKWINGWGKTELQKGDTIEADVEEVTKNDKTFYNIKSIKKKEESDTKSLEDIANKINNEIDFNKAFMKRCFEDANEMLKPFFSDGFVNPEVLSTTAHTLFLSIKNKH